MHDVEAFLNCLGKLWEVGPSQLDGWLDWMYGWVGCVFFVVMPGFVDSSSLWELVTSTITTLIVGGNPHRKPSLER